MDRPDITDLTLRITTLESNIESFKASLDSYQAGRGERFGLSSAAASWKCGGGRRRGAGRHDRDRGPVGVHAIG